jgi:ferric-dicitrate binding protein FerR (iron transport regulator)
MNPNDCHHLIQQLLDGEIPAEDFARLDEELRRNPEALAAYRLYAGIHCGLVRRGEIDAAIRSAPVVPIERLMVLQRQRIVRTSLLAAAAVVLISGLVLWQTAASEKAAAQATFQSAPGSSFTVSHTADGKTMPRSVLSQGSKITLDHGAIELSFPHQVRAILEAPATLTLVDDRTVDLGRGRGFFEVKSPEGHGFTVETPHQRIVDLGTAFGVELPVGSDETHLHVFEGSVRIEGMDGKATGETIRAPRAVSIRGSKIAGQLEGANDRFRRRLPERVENVFTEDFESGLLADKEYAVSMDPTAILDLAGNRFAGISSKNPWRFSTSKELRIRNPGFEDAEVAKGMPVPHWREVTGARIGFNTYAQLPKPTEGALLLHVSEELMLVQDLDVPIRAGSTYTLTLDVGSDPWDGRSEAVIRFFGSDSGFGSPLAEITVDPPEAAWLRDRTLSFTASAAEGTGQTLGIALSSVKGRVTFDDLRIFEARAGGQPGLPAPPFSESDSTGQPDTRSPLVSSFDPAPATTNLPPDVIPSLVFDEPVRFGTGRIIVKNLTDGTESELIVGSRFTSLDGGILTILPPLGLPDDGSQNGGIPGWESSGPVSRFNPGGNGPRYRHPDLADNSKARGTLGTMNGPTLATLGSSGHAATLRRPLGKAEDGRIYTVSVGIGHRSLEAARSTPFPGYRIRLLRGSAVLSEVSGRTPPGPPNSVTPVGFSWDSGHSTGETATDAPLFLEISTLAPEYGQSGDLDIDHAKVTSLDSGGN